MKEQFFTPLRCLIIDDELAAHKSIKYHISSVPWLIFSKSCMNAVEALEVISKAEFDIVFLDIDMPQISGIKLLEITGPIKASIIMTTAHAEFAIDGFNLGIEDFLLKPVSFERFLKAVHKVRISRQKKWIWPDNQKQESPQQYGAAQDFVPFQIINKDSDLQVMPHPAGAPFFGEKILWIKVDKDVVAVGYKDLYMIRSIGNYVRIFVEGKNHIVRTSLSVLHENLPDHFIMTSRSYIVNSELVTRFTGTEVFMNIEGYIAKLSKEFRNEVFKKLNARYG